RGGDVLRRRGALTSLGIRPGHHFERLPHFPFRHFKLRNDGGLVYAVDSRSTAAHQLRSTQHGEDDELERADTRRTLHDYPPFKTSGADAISSSRPWTTWGLSPPSMRPAPIRVRARHVPDVAARRASPVTVGVRPRGGRDRGHR